jgi:hypothetical protein
MLDAAAAQKLGDHGCVIVRSAARWAQWSSELKVYGWKEPIGSPFNQFDFSKRMIVCVFKTGEGLAFKAPRTVKLAMEQMESIVGFEIVLHYLTQWRKPPAPGWHYALVEVPQAMRVNLSVTTMDCGYDLNGSGAPGKQEWSCGLGPQEGDLVDGLKGSIKPVGKTFQPGDDIRIEFELGFKNPFVEVEKFAVKFDNRFVWDNVYSEGYRNHAFLVERPDGTVQILRLAERRGWDKNAPHPVEIKADTPYKLPGPKSLRELGLITDKPGEYRITGFYSEVAGETENSRQDLKDKPIHLWGGNIATNTLKIQVGGEAKSALQPQGAPRRALADFLAELDKSLTPGKAEEKFGKPDRITGSGLFIYKYTLDDGRELSLGFPGMGPITYAIVVAKDGSVTKLELTKLGK